MKFDRSLSGLCPFLTLLGLAAALAVAPGCSSPASQEPAVAAKGSAFVAALQAERAALPEMAGARTQKAWMARIHTCLASEERSSGDRYACLASLLEPRLGLRDVSDEQKRVLAAVVADALLEARLKTQSRAARASFVDLGLSVLFELALFPRVVEKQAQDLESLILAEQFERSGRSLFLGNDRLRGKAISILADQRKSP